MTDEPIFYGDEDIKIAPSDLSQLRKQENPDTDDNIDLYLRERRLGNTDRAKALGRSFVADLIDCVWTKAPEAVDPAVFDTQLKILFVYAMHRTVDGYSQNHILANTAIASFYELLEAKEPVFFEALCQSAAFTMYLYAHRSRQENAESVGSIFASMCGVKGNGDCAAIGESAYARFTGACVQRMADAGYRADGEDSHEL